MTPPSLDRLISHDPTAEEEVAFWEGRVVRLIDKQDETDNA
jgi:hypothetical protein